MCESEKNLCQYVEDFFDGEMTAEETRDFELHLTACPTCQHRIKELQVMRNALQDVSDLKLPDEADLRIRHQLHEQIGDGSEGDEILDIEGLAQLLKIPVSEVVKRLNELPAFEIAGRIRFRRDRIEKWIHDQEVKLSWERTEQAHQTKNKIIQFPGGM
ncbi:zf-HC2 domain-containing protein [candidate division CSSED10-310 bacterium]|uniref:Zf-HC2 domain-containing protein n=1 Tax=candidate division CSSED10-310 bacterium TaxID=2855610 RepID=A0ABV6Z3F6_UNCC1